MPPVWGGISVCVRYSEQFIVQIGRMKPDRKYKNERAHEDEDGVCGGTVAMAEILGDTVKMDECKERDEHDHHLMKPCIKHESEHATTEGAGGGDEG